MKRRDFLKTLGLTPFIPYTSTVSYAASVTPGLQNTLVLIWLNGGNDGINTVIPYADPEYYKLRPKIAIPRDQVLQLNQAAGLHPQMASLMPLWKNQEMAIVQGVGYPSHVLSHFRSIDIWHTASNANEVITDGWLSRFYKQNPIGNTASSGVIVGLEGMGPFAESTDVIALTSVKDFLQQAGTVDETVPTSTNPALQHIFDVEHEIKQASKVINTNYVFKTVFPATGIGNSLKAAAQIIASNAGVGAIRTSMNGFDNHAGQLATQANLLKQLSEAIAAFRLAMIELNKWRSTMLMTYAEFGRRPMENASGGTDHGTVNSHFVIGGSVKGGLYGQAPQLASLKGSNTNLPHAIDFRSLYATVIENWWGKDANRPLNGNFPLLDILKP